MSVDAFGSPAIELTPDPRVRVQPAHPGTEEPADQHEPAAVGGGSRLGAWVLAWLGTQRWYTEPQPSIPTLVRHARVGEWTTRDQHWQRRCRLVWLYAAATPARVPAWLVQRIWLRGEAPRFGGDQPSLAELVDHARAGTRRNVGLGCLAIPLSWMSHRLDSGAQTIAGTIFLWLFANWANNVPGLARVVPDGVTAAYWWRIATTTVAGVAATAQGALPDAQRAGEVIVMVLAALAGAGWLLFKRNKGETS